MVNPGKMRERIDLQRASRTPDGQGGWTEGWATYATVHARVRPLSSRDQWVAMSTGSRTTHEVTVRTSTAEAYPDALSRPKASDRVLWNGNVLRPTGAPVNRDEHRRYLTFPAVLEDERAEVVG